MRRPTRGSQRRTSCRTGRGLRRSARHGRDSATRSLCGGCRARLEAWGRWHRSRSLGRLAQNDRFSRSQSRADGVARGSARTFGHVSVYDALASASPLLSRFGGHAAAAGLSIDPANIDELRGHLETAVSEQLSNRPPPVEQADADVENQRAQSRSRDRTRATSAVRQRERRAPHGCSQPRGPRVALGRCRSLAPQACSSFKQFVQSWGATERRDRSHRLWSCGRGSAQRASSWMSCFRRC